MSRDVFHRIGALEVSATRHDARLEVLEKVAEDHEERIRPLEHLRSQLTALAFLGAAVGAAIVNYLFSRVP
jgi:uncharacterized protein YbaP (TraB family)